MTICGLIAHYGDEDGSDARAALMARGKAVFDQRGVRVGDLFVGDFVEAHEAAFLRDMAAGWPQGRSSTVRTYARVSKSIPAAFAEMLRGANFGKMLVQVSPRSDPGLNTHRRRGSRPPRRSP
jgi:NADPH-dependent curcumin reductase CurA